MAGTLGAPMDGMLEREERLLGRAGVERLQRARVAVFGLGGVGGHAAEALVRCGVGHLALVDGDVYSPTNLNRQLFATTATLGVPKARAAGERLRSIAPEAEIEEHPFFYTAETAGRLDFARFDYMVDAVDMVTAKLAIIQRAVREGVPVISAMGAGNKLDPTAFRVGDIYETSVCPLARVMRRELRRLGIAGLKVVYSTEPPLPCGMEGDRPLPGSVAFVPPAAGLALAGEVVKDLIGWSNG